MCPTKNHMGKILIVEDDKVIQNMYKIKFTNAGHEVKTASNGEEGLSLMRSFSPDIVFMDLMMPVMDGFTALTTAKADSQIKDIPVIILTNLSQSEDAEKTTKMGAVDFLVKSNLTPTQVLEKANQYLKK
jgi:CheY-like chemotaxis protein